jgi:VWFA-related protein
MIRCTVAFILLAAATLSSAQNIADQDYKVVVDVQLVQLPVSVMDKHGLSVQGLPQEYFSVYEDKVLQDISVFKQEDAPVSICLVIDVSTSMSSKLDRLQAAAKAFVRASNPEDETAVVTFADQVFLEQDFKGRKNNLSLSVADPSATGGTAFYDAVLLAAKYLEENGAYEKKVLLVVSDGEDNASRYNLKQVLRGVSESKVIVYSVGLLSSESYTYGVDPDIARKAFRQLAEVTGGAYFYPRKVNQVTDICTKIAHDLRSQYTIGYRPSNPNLDGSWRKVVVRLNPPKNSPDMKVRTKQGYYAPVGKRKTAKAE